MSKPIIVSLLIFTSLTNASFLFAKEIECPSVNVIKATSFDKIIDEGSYSWSGVILKNRFGTNVNWSFTLAYAYGDHKNEAAQILNKEMKTIQYDYKYGDNDFTACMYISADNQINGAAITPPVPY